MPSLGQVFLAVGIALGGLIAQSPNPAQASLAVAIEFAILGTVFALSPPNPDLEQHQGPDFVWFLAVPFIRWLVLAPFVLLALHTCMLAYSYPDIPQNVYMNGGENQLDTSLVTWSAATAIPLVLIFCVGIPFRLGAYLGLGTNFTFALREPNHLVTDGIYRYLQHPSYLGLLILGYSITILVFRIDGALSCWIPPQWYQTARDLWWWYFAPAWLVWIPFLICKRVVEEESLLMTKFGTEWENWHSKTARFIPGIF